MCIIYIVIRLHNINLSLFFYFYFFYIHFRKDISSSLNSAVVSVTVTQGRQPAEINNEVQILVEHLTRNPNNSACVFWNMDL